MKKLLVIAITLFAFGLLSQKAEAQMRFGVDGVKVSRDTDSVQVSLRLDLGRAKISRKELLWFTPRLVNGNDSVDLPAVCLYGRNPYYSYVRSGPYAFDADAQIRGKRAPSAIDYVQNVAFEPWMEQARLVMVCSRTNSCGDIMSESSAVIYVTPPHRRGRAADGRGAQA